MHPIVTLSQCTAALREGTTRSQALVDQALERIASPDGEGARAFTRVYADAARQAAKVSDTLRAAGQSPLTEARSFARATIHSIDP